MIRRIHMRVLSCCCIAVLSAGLCGCESFVKKFRREKPQDEKKKQEVILAPQEYAAAGMNSLERYQQHFIVWRAWQDELIDSLYEGGNRKQQLDALRQGLRNLQELVGLLDEEKAASLALLVARMKELEVSLTKDSYGVKVGQHRREAEQLRSQVIREFSPRKAEGNLR